MTYLGDFRLGDTLDFKFTTRQISGAPTTLAGTPAVSAYPGNSTTEITAGITLSVDFDSRTGLNNVRIVATSGNGYATATNYAVVITAGTVNSVSVVGETVAHFSIEARSAVMPTTAARTLAVDASGGVTLADGVSHGGTLGSSTATLAISRLSVVSQSANTNAVTATGNGTGHGMALTSGAGATGNGLTLLAASTNGHGLKSTGTGTGDGAELTAGASGADLDADMTGNITGNLSGSAGSVTGAVGSVTGNVGGNVVGSVGSVTGAVGSVTGAVGSVTGAVGSVTGNVGGNVTGSVGSLAAQAKADVNAEVVDGLATDTYAEPAQGAPAATASLKDKIGYLYKAWRNKTTQTSTTYSLFNDDAATVDHKATVSDDATTYTRGEVATGP